MCRRLEWARAHRQWSEIDWRSVLFSDEKKLLPVNAHLFFLVLYRKTTKGNDN